MNDCYGDQIRREIFDFIVQRYFREGDDLSILQNDTPLVTSSIIDSLDKQELLVHVKREYGVEVDPYEEATEFESINHIAAMIVRKKTMRMAA